VCFVACYQQQNHVWGRSVLFGGPVFTPSLIKSNRSIRCDSQRVQLSERDQGETSTVITFSALFGQSPRNSENVLSQTSGQFERTRMHSRAMSCALDHATALGSK